MKELALNVIRTGHLHFFSRDLPDRIALYFHELEPEQVEAFSDAMAFFHDRGYSTCNARDFVASAAGEKRLFVSFDDNFRTWHDHLDTINACDVTCTFFTNTGPLRDRAEEPEINDFFDRINHHGIRQTLSSHEVRAIADAGHTIGCHTHSHPVLSKTRRVEWAREIARSKGLLEAMLGQEVPDFSFPFGMRRHFSSELRDYCKRIGFKTISTGISGLNHAPAIDPLKINRAGWKFGLSLEENIANLKVDARLYAGLFGRSALG